MIPFEIDSAPEAVRLRLNFDVTIEHARALHQALRVALTPGRPLLVDLVALTRIDAAILQVLIAAACVGPGARLSAPSAVWSAALQRHGLSDPFVQP